MLYHTRKTGCTISVQSEVKRGVLLDNVPEFFCACANMDSGLDSGRQANGIWTGIWNLLFGKKLIWYPIHGSVHAGKINAIETSQCTSLMQPGVTTMDRFHHYGQVSASSLSFTGKII